MLRINYFRQNILRLLIDPVYGDSSLIIWTICINIGQLITQSTLIFTFLIATWIILKLIQTASFSLVHWHHGYWGHIYSRSICWRYKIWIFYLNLRTMSFNSIFPDDLSVFLLVFVILNILSYIYRRLLGHKSLSNFHVFMVYSVAFLLLRAEIQAKFRWGLPNCFRRSRLNPGERFLRGRNPFQHLPGLRRSWLRFLIRLTDLNALLTIFDTLDDSYFLKRFLPVVIWGRLVIVLSIILRVLWIRFLWFLFTLLCSFGAGLSSF